MAKIIIYENGQQIEVDEDKVKIYEPFPPKKKEEETDASEYFELKAHAEGW